MFECGNSRCFPAKRYLLRNMSLVKTGFSKVANPHLLKGLYLLVEPL